MDHSQPLIPFLLFLFLSAPPQYPLSALAKEVMSTTLHTAGRRKFKPFIETRVESAQFQRLTLTCNKLLSSFAFKSNLRHYNTATPDMPRDEVRRRRLTLGRPRVDRAWFQRLKLKYDELL